MPGMTSEGHFLNNDKPIVAVDLDGTLADYHGYFLKFAEDYLNKAMPDPEEINPGLPLSEFMGISHDTYRQVKLAYRQGGMKRSMPAFPHAKQMCQSIIEAGAELWICTTRPYLRLDNIDPDTREWLSRNEIEYTAMLFGESKYEDLIETVGSERVVAVVEDLPELVERAFKLGVKNAIMPRRPYNTKRDVKVRWMEDWEAERLYRPWNLQQATQSVLEVIDEYQDKDKGKAKPQPKLTISKPDSEGAKSSPEPPHKKLFTRLDNLAIMTDQYNIDREDRWLEVADEALAMFISKSRDYGKTGDSLGAKGQFADMWRKFGKLRHQVWDNPDQEISFEGTEEILKDIIGHTILFIDYLRRGNND